MNTKIAAIMSALLVSCTGVLTSCSLTDGISNKAEKAMEEFVGFINNGDYGQAESLLSFTNAPTKSFFSDFCKARLQNVTYTLGERAGNNVYPVTIQSDTDTFDVTLRLGENSNKIQADDFVSEYKIQFASIIDYRTNPDYMHNGQYIGNGITEYTNYTYKTDSIQMTLETDIGDSMVPDISTSILLDSDGVPESVEYCNDYYDKSNITGHVTVSDGIIKVNKYKVEYYYENFVSLFEEVFDSIVECSINRMTFSEFVDYRHKSFVQACITDNPAGMEEYYNQMFQSTKTNKTGYSYKYRTDTCNYGLYTLGEDYIMSFNGELVAYNSRGEQVDSSGASTFYVRFELNNKDFEVADLGNSLSEVQAVKEPETTEPATKVSDEEIAGLKDWQKAYILEIENFKNNWATSNGAKDSDFSYSLLYIDDDDIPELIMRYNLGDGKLLTYKDGEIVYVDNSMTSRNRWATRYIEKSGKYFAYSSGSAWQTFYDVFDISDGTRKSINEFKTDIKDVATDSMYYFFDNTELSEEEWHKKLKEVENEFTEITFSTYIDIIEQIMNTKASASSGTNNPSNSDTLNWEQAYENIINDIDANSGKSVTKVKAGGGLNMRKKADQNAEKVTLIPNHAVVEVAEESDGWSKVKYKKYTGWVKSSYLTESTSPSAEDYYYSKFRINSETSPLFVVSGSDTEYEGMVYRYANGKAELILELLPGEDVQSYSEVSNLFVVYGELDVDPTSEIVRSLYYKYYTYKNGELNLTDEVTRTTISQAGTDDHLVGTDLHNQDTWQYLENKYGQISEVSHFNKSIILNLLRHDVIN